jgi:hypothetical protein
VSWRDDRAAAFRPGRAFLKASAHEQRVPWAHIFTMDEDASRFLNYTAAIAGALSAAGLLGYVAHYGLGLSRQEIRAEGLFAACIFAGLVAVEFFSEKCRKGE